MKKRIVSLLLVVLMVASLVPVSHAEGDSSTCTHENTEIFTAVDGATETWTPVDNREHDWSFDDLTIQRCLDCGHEEIIDRTPKTERHPHDYDAYGVCQHCKHENTCLHENTEHYEELIDKVFTDTGDASMHKETANSYETFDECQDCGQKLNIEVHYEAVEQYRSHIFENGICIFCGHVEGTTCAHTAVEESWGWLGEPTYTTINEQQHEISGQYYTHRHCMECGYEFERQEYTDIRTQVEDHSFDANGLCHECGYQKENICAHENIEEHWEWEDREPEFNYQDTGDDSVHAVTGNAVVTRSCADCGYVFSRVSERRTETESHDYENGVCLLCGHEAAANCQHENTRVEEFEDGYSYRDTGDNRYHEIYVINVTAIICTDCGAEISREEWENLSSAADEHQYDESGVCMQCGHVNTCAHENSEEGWDYSAPPSFIAVDNASHIVTGQYYTYRYCLDCGMRYDRVDQTEPHTEGPWSHSYNENGVCSECGHQNTCQHEHTEQHVMECWNGEYRYEDTGSNWTHLMYGMHSIETVCVDCGLSLSYELDEELTLYEGEYGHEYDENGVCAQCGHENDCEHLNTYISDYWKNWDENTFTDTGSDREHEVSGIYVYCEICSDCGQRLNVREEERVEIYSHDYDENGYCWRCGHTNTCAHENQGEFWRWENDSYQYVDKGEYHIQAGTYYTYTYCQDCGKQLSEERLETGERLDTQSSHEYGMDGKCVYCGHENACEHLNTYTSDYWKNWDENTFTDTGSNTEHEVSGIYVYCEICNDCGQRLSEREEQYARMESHDYDEDGYCWRCGHTNTCAHENAREEWGWIGELTYTAINNAMHTATGQYWTRTYCPDCYQWIGEQVEHEEDRIETYSHSYEDSVCRDCGYACSHESVTENELSFEDIYTEIPGNNAEHQTERNKTVQLICADCGAELGIENRTEMLGNWRHHFDEDGICYYCGHVNTCTHSNAVECWNWSGELSYESINERQHVMSGKYYTEMHCPDCDQHYNYQEHEDVKTLITSHEFFHNEGEDAYCALCGFVLNCTHENAEEHWEWYWDENPIYEDANDQYHLTTGGYSTHWWCPDCGLSFGYQVHEDTRTEAEPHQFELMNNGVSACYYCGHTNTCAHENIIEQEGGAIRGYEEIAGNDQFHLTYYKYKFVLTICADCQMIFDETDDDYPVAAQEQHNYDENGVCRQCGHVNSCEHLNAVEENWGWIGEPVYLPIDNRSHTVTGRYYTEHWCPDCERWIDHTEHEEERTEIYSHDYDENGVCRQCGHVNSCEHLNAVEENWGWIGDPVYLPIDNRSHTVTGRYYTAHWCPDCERWIDYTEHEEERTEIYSHNYNDEGVCTLCGHVNTCPHENVDDSAGYTDWFCTDIDDNRVHEFSIRCVERFRVCNDCGQTFDVVPCDEWETETRDHNYDENGVCTECGHVNTCQHENTRTDEYGILTSYADVGDNRYHDAVFTYVTRTICDDCGIEISRVETEGTSSGYQHNYDENGVCRDCHHVNTCEHPSMEERWYWKDWDNLTVTDTGSDGEHTVEGMVDWYAECYDCGQMFWEREELYSHTERHSYNEFGVCTLCGHENACEHANADQGWGWSDGSPRYEAVDNRNHVLVGNYYTYWHCQDCGMEFDRQEHEEERTKGPWPHNYDENGVCLDCGHENTCEHVHTEQRVDACWDGIYRYEDTGDNRLHKIFGRHVASTICLDCGMELASELDENLTLFGEFAHDYDENGVCLQCQHQNTCKHEHKKAVSAVYEAEQYTALDNTYHSLAGTGATWFRCIDCGQDRLELQENVPVSIKERHWYGQVGVCDSCGHVNTCTHENMIEDTWPMDVGNCEEIPGDNYSHIAQVYLEHNYSCPDCAYYKNEDDNVPTTMRLRHSYDENGICFECGHKNTCAHENAYTWRDFEGVVFSEIAGDNRYCQAYAAQYGVITECEDCGQTLNREFHNEPITERWGHDYDANGECTRCGHVNTCEHAHLNTYTWWQNDNTVTYQEIEGNNELHRATGLYCEHTYCADCGAELSRVNHDEPRTLISRHDYHGGVCRQCGHVNTCEHEQTITETWWQDYDNRSYQEIEGDNRQHIVTGLYYEYKYCLDCGTELDRVYCSEPRTAKEWHHYGNGDVCEQCGHKNTCTHEDAHEETWWNDTDALIVEQIEGDNRYHMATGKYHSYTRCSECGVEFNVIYFEEPRTIKQDHEYDLNGVCKRCGYVNQCQHENTEEITSLYDLEHTDFGDNYYHQAIANRYVTYLYCHDCGQQFNREAHNEQITELWKHDYNIQGVCRDCGHVNTCTHHEVFLYYAVSYDGTAVEIDETSHAFTGVFWKQLWCSGCGQAMGENVPTTLTDEVMEHSMTTIDGKATCYLCGFICEHPQGLTEEMYFISRPLCTYEPIDAEKHRVVDAGEVDKNIILRHCCPICGWYDNSDGEYIHDMTEQHAFENGVCIFCGEKEVTAGWQKIDGELYYYTEYGTKVTDWIKLDGKWYYFNSDGVMQTGWQEIGGKRYYLNGDGVMQTGWQKIGGKWYYFASGGAMQTGWLVISGNRYYLNSNGVMQTDWQEIDGNRYYFSSGGVLQIGWLEKEGIKYYFNESGVMLTGWQDIEGIRYYFDNSGNMQTGWQDIESNRYHFTQSGAMQIGWQDIDSNRYYFNESGAMQIGWQIIDTKWYYFNNSGIMQTGWQKISDKWYYFNAGGDMVTGWQKISSKWYYFNSSGIMQTGWQKISDKWYYFNAGGDMVTGWQKISSKWYYFNSSGIMQTGWQKISDKWYYFNAGGDMVTGWQKISSKWYYFNTSGVMQTGWQKISDKWYYFNSGGDMVTGWKQISSKWYYFNSSGVMLTGTQTIGGKTYVFDSSGACTNP